MNLRTLALVATAAAALSGCAHGGGAPDAELASLREQVRALRDAREKDHRRIEALEVQLAALARRNEAARTAAPPAVPPPVPVVKLAPAPAPASAPAEEEDDSFVFIVDRGDGAPEPAPASRPLRHARRAVGAPGGVDKAPPLPTDVPLQEPETGPDAYDEGLALLASGDLAGAAARLERFLAQHPGDRRADNAGLALGEVLRQQQQPGRALQVWERVATDYPAGDAVPDALLRYGETCRALGRGAAADAAFRRVVQDWPGTDAGRRAAAHLAEGK